MPDNLDDVFRSDDGATEATQVFRGDELADQRAREKAERDRALGKVERSEPQPLAPVVHKPTTDRFHTSAGLFLLRAVTAAIMGIHGVQKLTDVTGTATFMKSLGMPSPHWLAIGTGCAEVLAAVALFFGLMTRLAGLGTAAIGILALIFVKWRDHHPFVSGQQGFNGEVELLLAAVGIALFTLGAGRWAIDGQVRSNRRKAKLEG